jgi:uncharacterized membrane protein YkvA (DUF1232 family)
MLNALANHLKTLAENSPAKFRAEVKQRLNGKCTDDQIAAIKEFIFLLPATLNQLSLYWNRKDTPPDAKRVSGFIITYIYQLSDFLPEDQHGLFGYLDDAYFVVKAYLQINDRYLRNWQDRSHEEMALSNRAHQLIEIPRHLIPNEADKIDKMVESLMDGRTAEFDAIISGFNS